jgi:hypothetical protein
VQQVVDAVAELADRAAHGLAPGVERLAAAAQRRVQQLRREERRPAPPLVEDHLRERLRGDVLAGGLIDHPHGLAGAHERREVLERHVRAGPHVVELAVRVAPDEARGGGSVGHDEMLTRRVI